MCVFIFLSTEELGARLGLQWILQETGFEGDLVRTKIILRLAI